MATNNFKKQLKQRSNNQIIEKELRLLEISPNETTQTDSLYRTLYKIKNQTKSKLVFFDSLTWYSDKIASLDNVRVMFMSEDISDMLLPTHNTMRSIRTRLPKIKEQLAKEYQLGLTLLSEEARYKLNSNSIDHMDLKFIVFRTETSVILWIKSLIHGSEYLKVGYDVKTNKIITNL